MCGIAGYIGVATITDDAVSRALSTMINRGPDHQGFSRHEITLGRSAVLLSSRLAIVDLDTRSNMPFQLNGWTIVYNGEIYNHVAVRSSLEKEGVSFRTTSDTEVLLFGLIREGISFLDKFEGMWAFAALEEKTGKIIISRDRFGEKPLFLHRDSSGIYFSSEVKTLRALSGKSFSPNYTHLLRYLVNGYKSLFKTEETWFDDIIEFPARGALVIDPNGRENLSKYWEPKYLKQEISEDEAVFELRKRLEKTISLRLRADVPVACCLSGGIDSAGIASLASKNLGARVTTFSIFDENPDYDERRNIKAVVDDIACDAHFVTVPKAPFLERLRSLIEYHDGPIATISYYIHSFLSEAISKGGYKVALSGTGADELLTGYYDHFLFQIAEISNPLIRSKLKSDWEKHILPLVRNPLLRDPDRFVKTSEFRDHIYLDRERFIDALIVPFTEGFHEVDFGAGVLRNRMLNELFYEVVPPLLREDDLNSMKWSVENRSPYLDRDLFEFCASLPTELLIKDGRQKYLLRKAYEGILVDSVRLDRRKVGFNANITSLLDRNSPECRQSLLDDNPLLELVKKSSIEELLQKPTLDNAESKFLFNIVCASIFLNSLAQ